MLEPRGIGYVVEHIQAHADRHGQRQPRCTDEADGSQRDGNQSGGRHANTATGNGPVALPRVLPVALAIHAIVEDVHRGGTGAEDRKRQQRSEDVPRLRESAAEDHSQ
jgi:hypothetical protein